MFPVILTGVPGEEPAKHSSGPNCLFSPEQEESPGGIHFCCLLKVLWLLEGSLKIFLGMNGHSNDPHLQSNDHRFMGQALFLAFYISISLNAHNALVRLSPT